MNYIHPIEIVNDRVKFPLPIKFGPLHNVQFR